MEFLSLARVNAPGRLKGGKKEVHRKRRKTTGDSDVSFKEPLPKEEGGEVRKRGRDGSQEISQGAPK